MNGWEFARPELLYLLLLIPFWIVLTLPWARGGILFTRSESARRAVWRWDFRGGLIALLPRVLRAIAVAALIVALADPIRTTEFRDLTMQGKGMGLAVDLSSSMLAEDMEAGASRIEVAREAAVRFAQRREYDELSLVGFAGEAIARVPPTLDSELIVEGVETLEVQLVRDGTDISDALLTGVEQLLRSDREPRVMVLLTDGAHNGITMPPLTAARAVAALGVRVHAISVVGPEAMSAMQQMRSDAARRGQSIGGPDMQTVLGGIASITGGRYFHAGTAAALDSIYAEIDRIEAPTPEVSERTEEESLRMWPLLIGLLVMGTESLLRGSRWGILP